MDKIQDKFFPYFWTKYMYVSLFSSILIFLKLTFRFFNRFDPLWNSILVGGMQEGKPFLGCVDMIGTAWQENAIATGIGAAMAIPIIK